MPLLEISQLTKTYIRPGGYLREGDRLVETKGGRGASATSVKDQVTSAKGSARVASSCYLVLDI